MPRVSVIVPCFNYGVYLPDAVGSVLAQTYDDYEVLIVDDGSTDGSVEVARRLAAERPDRVRLLEQPNAGQPAYGRNNGIAATNGEYVLCLDADDEISPNFVERCIAVLDAAPEISIAYPDQQNIGLRDDFEPHPEYDLRMLARFNFVPPASLFRRRAWEDAGGFNTNVAGYEDWDFWLGCGAAGHHGRRVPEARWRYRHHGDSLYGRQVDRDPVLKATVVQNHPSLYGPAQHQWAAAVLAGDEVARGLGGLGVVPAFAGDAAPAHRFPLPDRPHVLFTMVGWADEGGGTILPRQIAKALVRRGHRVTVLYAPVEELPGAPAYHLVESEDDGVRLLALYNRPTRFNDPLRPDREIEDPHVERVVERLLDELKPDVAHLHSLLGFSMALPRALHEAGVPSVFTSHNYWPICPRMYLFRADLSLCDGPEESGNCAPCLGARGSEPLYAERLQAGRTMLGEHVDRHLAVSRRVRELYERAEHDGGRIHVLHQQPESADWLWERLGADRPIVEMLERPLRVGFIGSLYAHKGVHVLVEAAQALPAGSVEVHLFGGGSADYAEELRMIDAAGAVRFHGGYDPADLPDLLGAVDVVSVPSIWEDCAPLVVAEALAARAPVVASEIGGIPDFVADGATGLLVRPRDPDALAAALRRFVDDPMLLGRMQRAIAPPKGFDAYLDELLAHYRGAFEDRRGRAGRIPGARRFAVLAAAGDLVGDPGLLAAYARHFSGEDDATLVVHGEPEGVGELEAAIATAGADGPDGPDLLAVFDAVEPAELAARVDAILRPGTDVGALRAAAQQRWAA